MEEEEETERMKVKGKIMRSRKANEIKQRGREEGKQ